MAKPSIFSKNYERRMRRRRNKIIFTAILAIVVAVIISFNSEIKNFNLTNVKDKMQAWVDSGKQNEEIEEVEQVEEVETPKTPEKTYIDINVAEGIVAKAEYIEEDGKKKFVSVEPIDGISFNISPLKEQILFLDKSQNLKIANNEGVIKDLTKKEYVSQAGQSFPKDQILSSTPTYIWHSQGKFIDDTKIIYVSELPFFQNNGQKQFVWLYDLATGNENPLWNLVGNQIVVGDIVPDKGIAITVNGVVFYLKADGSVSK